MFAQLGITKSDIDLVFNTLLLGTNVYFVVRMNSARVNDELLKTLQEEKNALADEVRILSHKIKVLTIKQRKENGTNEHQLA